MEPQKKFNISIKKEYKPIVCVALIVLLVLVVYLFSVFIINNVVGKGKSNTSQNNNKVIAEVKISGKSYYSYVEANGMMYQYNEVFGKNPRINSNYVTDYYLIEVNEKFGKYEVTYYEDMYHLTELTAEVPKDKLVIIYFNK